MKTMKFIAFAVVLTAVAGLYAAETDVTAQVAPASVVEAQVPAQDVVTPVTPIADVKIEDAPKAEVVAPIAPTSEVAQAPAGTSIEEKVAQTVEPKNNVEAPAADVAKTEPKTEQSASAQNEPSDAELEKFFEMLAQEQGSEKKQ